MKLHAIFIASCILLCGNHAVSSEAHVYVQRDSGQQLRVDYAANRSLAWLAGQAGGVRSKTTIILKRGEAFFQLGEKDSLEELILLPDDKVLLVDSFEFYQSLRASERNLEPATVAEINAAYQKQIQSARPPDVNVSKAASSSSMAVSVEQPNAAHQSQGNSMASVTPNLGDPEEVSDSSSRMPLWPFLVALGVVLVAALVIIKSSRRRG